MVKLSIMIFTRPVTLRVRTEFSLLNGMIKIKEIKNYEALAITDLENLFGASRFTDQCISEKIYPILGVTLQEKDKFLYLYVQNEEGYKNLCKILSFEGSIFARLEKNTDGLLALLGEDGDLNWASQLNLLFLNRWAIALPSYGNRDPLITCANRFQVPLIASNIAYFSSPEEYQAHDVLCCIAEKRHIDDSERKKYNEHNRFLSEDEWNQLFRDYPIAVENTILWAQKCAFFLKTHKQVPPKVNLGSLEDLARVGIKEKQKDNDSIYLERLEYEIQVIKQLELSDYFLIVADYVNWAKKHNIPTGGRGSGAGSLVAWCINITDLDPISFGLVFERFLNPERVSMADFDIDFCQERRHEVIGYIKSKYGAENISHIVTFGTLQPKAVLRDVGRVLGMRYTDVDNICKLIPYHPLFPVNLEKALTTEPLIKEMIKNQAEVKRLWELASKLEGLPRHVSTHAAGIIISDQSLINFMPIKKEGDSNITHLDMYAVERLGFVKFDILGLSALTLIEKTRVMLAKANIKIEWNNQFNDQKVYGYLSKGNTYGIFQLDSFGIREVIKQMKPNKFEELIALNALYRPGPVENIAQYLAFRKDPKKIEYLIPELEEILKETYGIIVYQEQVLQIAQKIAGYTLGEADLLRRAIGKKIKSEMDKQKEKFIKNANKGAEIFNLIEKFAQYGFVKAHAACYALIMYRTAYLKAYYPQYFICANMELDLHFTLKMICWIMEAKREDVRIFPPCVNASFASNSIEDNSIRYGLSSIKGVGEGLAKKIATQKPFKSLDDFIKKVMPDKLGFENLAKSNALSCFGYDAHDLLNNSIQLLNSGQRTLFTTEIITSKVSMQSQINNYLSVMPDFLTEHPLAKLNLFINEYAIGILLHIDRRRSKSGAAYGVIYLSNSLKIYEISIFSSLWDTTRSKLAIGKFIAVKVDKNLFASEVRTFSQTFRFRKIVLKILSPWVDLTSLEQLPIGNVDLVLEATNNLLKYYRSIAVDMDILYLLSNIKDIEMKLDFTLKRL